MILIFFISSIILFNKYISNKIIKIILLPVFNIFLLIFILIFNAPICNTIYNSQIFIVFKDEFTIKEINFQCGLMDAGAKFTLNQNYCFFFEKFIANGYDCDYLYNSFDVSKISKKERGYDVSVISEKDTIDYFFQEAKYLLDGKINFE